MKDRKKHIRMSELDSVLARIRTLISNASIARLFRFLVRSSRY